MKGATHVYAIIRIDKFIDDYKNAVTVKEVVLSLEDAEKEVERLNRINSDKDCLYFWQTTRLISNI
ncbi:hypothetical protein [Pseudobacteroides cellulosolvens]|uniref:Uncharacterized protein n=1 Tax=Pseudobacteroides cellulosolvens ATCC 35603 = DSM 2933 TaxID=398512 RepID=A0A0L6JJ64_9FIRM|nr:hypothetical protein [Pseudobacteroides cellulosolvens]KNY25482.1 hypothetical protein Bccel_0742 [Pseudobacteroides cellulosolvens ATCC 35603 = DSM 2933]